MDFDRLNKAKDTDRKLLYRLELTAPKEKIVSTNKISTAMFGASAQMRGAFYGMKTYLKQQTQLFYDSHPAKLKEKVHEVVTVGNLKGIFDPVNYHPSEKIIVDTLIKNGLLPDDNSEWIPFVTFKAFKLIPRSHWLFRLDFYALNSYEKELLKHMDDFAEERSLLED